MAMFAAIGPIVSGIASIAGAMVASSAASSQADAERQVAEANAREMEKQAAVEQSKGALESQRVADQVKAEQAKTKAAMAQGGFDVYSGTPSLLNGKLKSLGDYEMNIRMFNAQNAQRKLMAEADIQRYQGEVKAQALEGQSVASLLGGIPGAIKGFGGALTRGGGGDTGLAGGFSSMWG